MNFRYCTVFAVAVLSSCAGKPVDEMTYTERQQFTVGLVKRCEAQGVKPGDPQMFTCIRQEEMREKSIRSSAKARRESIAVCQTVAETVICS